MKIAIFSSPIGRNHAILFLTIHKIHSFNLWPIDENSRYFFIAEWNKLLFSTPPPPCQARMNFILNLHQFQKVKIMKKIKPEIRVSTKMYYVWFTSLGNNKIRAINVIHKFLTFASYFYTNKFLWITFLEHLITLFF